MKMILFAILSLSVACKSTCKLPVDDTPVEKSAIERPANAGPGMEHADQAQDACVKACEQENAMRAVSAEVITADCLASCTGEHQTLGTKSLE
jgi:hypothetical protein